MSVRNDNVDIDFDQKFWKNWQEVTKVAKYGKKWQKWQKVRFLSSNNVQNPP